MRLAVTQERRARRASAVGGAPARRRLKRALRARFAAAADAPAEGFVVALSGLTNTYSSYVVSGNGTLSGHTPFQVPFPTRRLTPTAGPLTPRPPPTSLARSHGRSTR
jgi:hypothetical protein